MLEGVQIDGYKYADGRKFESEAERARKNARGESSMSNGKVQLENVAAGCYACIKFFIGDIRCPLTRTGGRGTFGV